MATPEKLIPLLLRLPAYLAAILPVILMYFIAYCASIYLSHWPSYNNPDPRLLPSEFDALFLVLEYSLILWFPLTIIFVLVGISRSKDPSNWPDIAYGGSAYGLMTLAGVFIFVIDPHGVWNWLID